MEYKQEACPENNQDNIRCYIVGKDGGWSKAEREKIVAGRRTGDFFSGERFLGKLFDVE